MEMHTHFIRSNLKVLLIGVATIASAFVVGIQTAGDVAPIGLIEAGGVEIPGDIDGSGFVDLQDAIVVLEIVQGYRDVSPEELRRDPNSDGLLTIDDALRILHGLELR